MAHAAVLQVSRSHANQALSLLPSIPHAATSSSSSASSSSSLFSPAPSCSLGWEQHPAHFPCRATATAATTCSGEAAAAGNRPAPRTAFAGAGLLLPWVRGSTTAAASSSSSSSSVRNSRERSHVLCAAARPRSIGGLGSNSSSSSNCCNGWWGLGGRSARVFAVAGSELVGERDSSAIATADEAGGPKDPDASANSSSGSILPPKSRKGFRSVSDTMVEEVIGGLGSLAVVLTSEDSPVIGKGNVGGDSALDGSGGNGGGSSMDASSSNASLANSMDVVQLLLSLWISKKSMVDLVRRCPHILRAPTMELTARVQYLMDLGCTAGEVGSAAVRDPKMLLAPVEQVEAMCKYLQEAGVSPDKVPRVLLKFPSILDMEPRATIQPLLDRLQELIGPYGDVERVVERMPQVLELSEEQLHERFALLSENVRDDQLSSLLYEKPGIMLLPPEVVAERFECLRGIFNSRRLPSVFKVAPGLLLAKSSRILNQHKRLGEYLGPAVADKVVNSFPQALTLSWEKVLEPKLEYLRELRLEPAEVANFPAYLGYKLSTRIRPRCELLLREGFEIRPHAEVIKSDAEERKRRFGRSHRDVLQQDGWHAVCIQHIVGLRDEDFEAQFGVRLADAPTLAPRAMAREYLTESDEGLEDDDDEAEEFEDEEEEEEEEGSGRVWRAGGRGLGRAGGRG